MKYNNSTFNLQPSTFLFHFLAVFLLLAICVLPAYAEDKAFFKGRVLDAGGKAVKGALLLVYDSPDVRRRVDFKSAATEADGRFQMVLSPGKYWAIARLKKVEGYGPLMPGDKHSGDPKEIELIAGKDLELDFTVLDIRSATNQNKVKEDYIKLKGRIVDGKGQPVKDAYVIANRNERFSETSDYLSAWTDETGQYTLYLPRGKYYIGSATAFPPGDGYFVNKEAVVDADKPDFDVMSK